MPDLLVSLHPKNGKPTLLEIRNRKSNSLQMNVMGKHPLLITKNFVLRLKDWCLLIKFFCKLFDFQV